MRVAIVVLNYNGLALTRRCLSALQQTTYADHEVIVVDNGSHDGSAEALPREFPDAHFLFLPANLGYTGGNNAGIQRALERGADAVLILNNDAIPDAAMLERLVAHEGAIAAPQIRSIEHPEHSTGVIGSIDWSRGVIRNEVGAAPLAETAAPVDVEFAAGCALLVPRKVLETVGAFDDRYFLYYEDTDFLVRARRAGVRVVVEPRAVLYHDEAGSTGGAMSPLRLYYATRNRLIFMRRNAPRFRFVFFAMYFLAGRAAYAVRYLLGRRWTLLAAMLRGIRDFAIGRTGRAEYRW